MIRGQNSFSRTVSNNAKMGAYYTDLSHCLDIGKFISFPEREEVSVLEPSIGDGSAVMAVTGVKDRPNIKIFGVELNSSSAKECKENPLFEEILEADFLEGVRIKNNAFSFCFGNPPYMEDDLDETQGTVKTEKQFLEKVTNYLAKDGLLVWVIPYKSFSDRGTIRFFMCHYEILSVFKFREDEYVKYHQVVIFARKTTGKSGVLLHEVEEAQEKYSIDNIDVLPSEPTNIYEVKPSESSKVTLFCAKTFDCEAAYQKLTEMGTSDSFADLIGYADKKLSYPRYVSSKLGKPPIPLKKDSLYLLATSGSGQGITGSIETQDLHLQRGIAEVVEDSEFEVDENGLASSEKVTTRTKVSMTVIETSGKITVLE